MSDSNAFRLGQQSTVCLGAAIRIHHGAALVFLSIPFQPESSLVGFFETRLCPGLVCSTIVTQVRHI